MEVFIALCCLLILSPFLVLENILIISAVVRRKEMRTARNIFIFNLALSDLLLATSIPFTVLDALTRAWPLQSKQLFCRLIFLEFFIILLHIYWCNQLQIWILKKMNCIYATFRLVKTFPCIAAFMSSYTIVAVAIDRFRIIIQSQKTQVSLTLSHNKPDPSAS